MLVLLVMVMVAMAVVTVVVLVVAPPVCRSPRQDDRAATWRGDQGRITSVQEKPPSAPCESYLVKTLDR